MEQNGDLDKICSILKDCGCDSNVIKDASALLEGRDTGFTFSNTEEKFSLVIIGRASSRKQLINSCTHELYHVVSHICENEGIDMVGEEPCYLMGWLCQEIIN